MSESRRELQKQAAANFKDIEDYYAFDANGFKFKNPMNVGANHLGAHNHPNEQYGAQKNALRLARYYYKSCDGIDPVVPPFSPEEADKYIIPRFLQAFRDFEPRLQREVIVPDLEREMAGLATEVQLGREEKPNAHRNTIWGEQKASQEPPASGTTPLPQSNASSLKPGQ